MKLLRVILTCSLLFVLSCLQAQSGPAGVLTDVENRFWFSSSFEKYFHLNDVEVFTNYGGSGIDATASAFQEPKFNNALATLINGYPSLKFDGVNDRFSLPNNADLTSEQQSKRTYFFTFKTSPDVVSTQVIYDEGNAQRGINLFINNNQINVGFYNFPNDGVGAPWGFYSASAAISPNTLYTVSFRFEGKNGTNGTIEVELNGTTIGEITNVGLLYEHVGMVGIGATQGNTFTQSGSSVGNAWGFKGELLEFIHYNKLINDVQYMLILNYLSAKFDIPLDSSIDLYEHDEAAGGNYDHDLAGIARINGSIINDDAQGTGRVRIMDPSNFNNDEYLLWAHDNGAEEATEINDIPANVTARFERVWRVNEIDRNHNPVNVGHIDMQWDLSELSPVNASDLVLLVDTDNDGLFADETYITGATDLGNDIFQFTNLTALSNNVRFTLGTLAFALLPVEFLEVSAYANGPSTAKITWSTASEINNDHFSIERSMDLQNWYSIGQVEGNGTTSELHEYSFIDFSPESGTQYYRIKQLDFSGQFDYSEVVSLDFISQISEIKVFPNPTVDILHIQVDHAGLNQASFRFTNMLGQDCTNLIRVKSADHQRMVVNVSNLAEGQYYISVNDQMTKIVIVH